MGMNKKRRDDDNDNDNDDDCTLSLCNFVHSLSACPNPSVWCLPLEVLEPTIS